MLDGLPPRLGCQVIIFLPSFPLVRGGYTKGGGGAIGASGQFLAVLVRFLTWPSNRPGLGCRFFRQQQPFKRFSRGEAAYVKRFALIGVVLEGQDSHLRSGSGTRH